MGRSENIFTWKMKEKGSSNIEVLITIRSTHRTLRTHQLQIYLESLKLQKL